jgi:HPt (histidine-containing phosphotransfer) domain-containing protein
VTGPRPSTRPPTRPSPGPVDPIAEFLTRAARDRARIAELARLLRDAGPWPRVAAAHGELEKLAHGLAGSGGTFGFPSVSDTAERVERLAERRRLRPPARYTQRQAARLAGHVGALLAALDMSVSCSIPPADSANHAAKL